MSCAAFSQVRGSRSISSQLSSSTEVASRSDSGLVTIALFLGGALPSYDAPQGPNLGGFSIGFRPRPPYAIGLDASFSATSEQCSSGLIVKQYSSLYGIALSYFPVDWFNLTVQPTLHRITYRSRDVMNNDGKFIATKYNPKVGVGAALRYGILILEGRLFPSFVDNELPEGARSSSRQYQFRLGIGFNFEAKR